MAKVANHSVSEKKPKIAERIAFQPFTPQQDLINELIRNMINPDNDIGRTYYVGEVVKIIEDTNPLIDNRDIFYSITDNSQRASKKDTAEKEYNADRVTLLVHIPSFITSNKVSSYDLNYDNFLKIRVEYNQKDKAIKVGNVVKIQFHKQNALYFPVVVDVVDVSLEDIEKSRTKAKEEFNKYLECKILAIDASNKIGANDYDLSNKPFGGYVQAVQEIENIFSPAYIEPFKKGLNQATYGNPAEIVIQINTISLEASVYAKFKENIKSNKTIATFTQDEIKYYTDNKQEYLILGKNVVIAAAPEKANQNINNELRKEFFNFLKQEFSSKLGYSFLTDKLPPGVDFELNINAFLSYKGNEPPSLKMYIDKSEKTISSPTFYSKVPTPNSSPQIIKQKSTVDKCDNQLPTDNNLYPLIYDGQKYGANHNTIDGNIIKLFYEDKVIQDDFINDNYFLKLAGLKSFDDLLKLNKTFYKDTTDDTYLATKNYVSIIYIKQKLEYLKKLLKEMQIYIWGNEKNATPNIIQNDVLIVPRQVLKIKKGIVSQEEDPNSRHYYGKAIDIAIYLKIKEDNKKEIRQIRPEIVLLYAEQVKQKAGIDVLGHGLFLEQQAKYYNHIEILTTGKEKTKKKNEKGFTDLTQNDRFFTGNLTDIEKQLEGTNNKLQKLKNIIRQAQEFKVPGPLNEIDQRFNVLTKG